MADNVLGTLFQDIADAIRRKTGDTAKIVPADFPEEIDTIEVGSGGEDVEAINDVLDEINGECVGENIYTVTFIGADGNQLGKMSVIEGDDCADPMAAGVFDEPTKESTVDTVYPFEGWSLADGGEVDDTVLLNVNADRVVYAVFGEETRKYTITFYDEDGTTVLYSDQFEYNATIEYTPTKDGVGVAWWIPELTTVTGDASYTVVWSSVLYSGTIAENTNISWSIDKSGVLTLEGTGAMPDYSNNSDQPYKDYEANVTKVVVLDGITRVGNYNFALFETSLKEVVLADSVTELGKAAFYGCDQLASVNMSNSLTQIGQSCFYYSSSLTALRIPSSVTFLGNAALHTTALTHLTLENPNGWGYAYEDTATSYTPIEGDLSDPESAATIYNNRPNGARWFRA